MTLVPAGQIAVTTVMNGRWLVILLVAVVLGAAACGSTPDPAAPGQTAIPTASAAPSEMSLFETGVQPFAALDFDAVHQPVDAGGNAALIFGALPVTPAATGTPPELAAFLGRWEGYGYGPPIRRDWRDAPQSRRSHPVTEEARSGRARTASTLLASNGCASG